MRKSGSTSPLLIFHTLVLGGLALLLGNTLLNLLVFRRPRSLAGTTTTREPPQDGERPLISVMVPARNEETRLGACLDSLLKQSAFGQMEVIVLDDHSTDRTPEIIAERGFTTEDNAQLRSLPTAELPPGWTGKSWACWQLAQAARGEWLVFTDADTIHSRECIGTAVQEALRQNADLLSLWPRQITVTWGERLVVPLIYLLAAGFLPQWLARLIQRSPRVLRNSSPQMLDSLGAANGQFMLFRREHYFGIGGHGAVRSHMVEDVALARLTMRQAVNGRRLVNCDGSHLIQCRMYESFSDVWEGFTKNLRSAFDHPAVFTSFGLFQWCAMVQPFVLLATARRYRGLVAAQVALIYIIRGLFAARFSTSWLSVLLHPIGHGVALGIAADSWRLTRGKGVTWKGRTYARPPLPVVRQR